MPSLLLTRQLWILLCAVSISLLSVPVSANGVDPLLIKALKQATVDEQLETTDLHELRWLSRMSQVIEKRVPDPFYRVRLLKTVFQEATNVGLDPQLVLAVIGIESNFDRYALSSAGAQGLMQVMPFWKDVLNEPEADLYNPSTSIRFGTEILRRYMDRYSNTEDALAAYNGSYGRSTYSDKILRRFRSRWQYENDDYTIDNQSKIAVTDQPSPGG